MNVLSLFDGMSCGQLALDKLGVEVGNYFAAEIDKYAIEVSSTRYPYTQHLGSVVDINGYDLPPIDLLIGGSPCQGFSFAGKQLNFDDPRSQLFFEFVRLLEETKPKYFLLENVKMKKEFQDVISSYLGVEPIEINSSLLSAQNRKRLYWTNIPNITQPEDQGIILKDILEVEVEDKYYPTISMSMRDALPTETQVSITDRDKAYCIDANYAKGGNPEQYFNKSRRQLVFNGLMHVANADIKGHDAIKRIYHEDGKAPTLTTMGGGHREPKVLCGAMRGRYTVNDSRQEGATKQYLEVRHDGKTNTLTTVQKDNNVVFTDSDNVRHEIDELRWRKLTPTECERLQTVPDGYTLVPWGNRMMSNSQRYKMLGNGWTVDVIAHILSFIPKEINESRLSR